MLRQLCNQLLLARQTGACTLSRFMTATYSSDTQVTTHTDDMELNDDEKPGVTNRKNLHQYMTVNILGNVATIPGEVQYTKRDGSNSSYVYFNVAVKNMFFYVKIYRGAPYLYKTLGKGDQCLIDGLVVPSDNNYRDDKSDHRDVSQNLSPVIMARNVLILRRKQKIEEKRIEEDDEY